MPYPPTKNIARWMVFVDGDYLRQNFKQKYEKDYSDFKKIIKIAKNTFVQEIKCMKGI